MKRPNLMVCTIIRRKYRKKYERKPPTSKTVRYFDSIENRIPRLTENEVTLYKQWTRNIRTSMTKNTLWPSGLEHWTKELVIEYICRLQSEFWKSSGLRKEFQRCNDLTEKHILVYSNRPKLVPQLRVFSLIYKKLRRQSRTLKICHLFLEYRSRTTVYTFAYDYHVNSWREKNRVLVTFTKFY